MGFNFLSGLGALGGLSSLFSKNPSKVANRYLDQIPDAMRQYYEPYMKNAGQSHDFMENFYKNLMSNPSENYNMLASGYKESPGYQFKLNQQLGASDAAQARGGMLGTPQHQQYNMQLANNIASQDFNDYMKSILSQQGIGVQGEQGLENQGYDASTSYGNMLGDVLGKKAGYAYAGQAGKNQVFGNTIRDLLSYFSRMDELDKNQNGGGM